MRTMLVILLAVAAVMAPTAWAHGLDGSAARSGPVCADHANQAAAQRAADTRDADGDGIYCESLPCPCSAPRDGSAPASPTPTPKESESCLRPKRTVAMRFSKRKYPNIRRHTARAIRKGWPRVLVLNRSGADERRDKLLERWDTRPGRDRGEYPPAIGRGRGKGLLRGSNPRGWKAHVTYIPSSENRSHGARLGRKLRRYCNGTKFRYVFR